MELAIKDLNNTVKGKVALPPAFSEPLRQDLIKKAIEAYWANGRQRYGADPMAGKKASAELSRRRRKYRGSYGFGISRIPRKILSRRGTRMYWVGAFAPGTVSGRRAHAPKAEKVWDKKINVKERRKALRSALAATLLPEIVSARGHKVPGDYPFGVDSAIESVGQAKEFVKVLNALGYGEELARTKERTVRAGKGKLRGRRHKTRTGLLIVVSDACALRRIGSVPGVDVVEVSHLSVGALAPGAHPGRVTLFTDAALKRMEEKAMFQ